ncbi:MAG: hypothetical protein NT091_02340, partial [Candidatus Falkowbacteria bacterium]|nr:hypothetical protein [Candidatus Falkowbacteria bacterium]
PQGEDAVTMAEELAKLLYQSAIQPLHDRYGADMISQLDKVDVKWDSYGESYSSEAEKAYWSPTVNQVDIGLGTVIPVDLGLNNPAKNQAELAGMSLKG